MSIDWIKKNEALAYDGFRKIVRRLYLCPDNQERYFDIKLEKDSACILALTPEQEVILARQFRPGPAKVLLELPGGGVENDEQPERAIERELLEETGFTGNVISLGSSYVSAYSTAKKHHFIALDCKFIGSNNPDEAEFIEVVKMPLEEFREILNRGELTDSETAFRALIHLQ